LGRSNKYRGGLLALVHETRVSPARQADYAGIRQAVPHVGGDAERLSDRPCVKEWFHYDVTMTHKSVTQKRRSASQRVPVTIRLPLEIVAQIDEELERRMVPVSRNNWLLEAAVEKLRRRNGGGRNGSK
jgi:hypothetical protein